MNRSAYDPFHGSNDEHIDDEDDELMDDTDCPKCESSNVIWVGGDNVVNVGQPLLAPVDFYRCNDCGHKFSR